MHRIRPALLGLGLSLAALGCEPAPPIQVVSGSDLTRPFTEALERPERSRRPPVGAEDAKTLAEYNTLLDTFLERSEDAFDKPETEGYLPGLERFFVATGRTFEMLDLYRTVYDQNGPRHYVAPRLAWAYVSVGRMDEAQKISDASLTHRPNDPMSHFVDGYLASRAGEPSVPLIRKVRAAWSKALELDPNFKGPGSITARMLKVRIQEMDRVLKQSGESPTKAPTPPPTPPAPEARLDRDAEPEAPGPSDEEPAEAPEQDTPTEQPVKANPKLVEAETKLAFSDFSGAAGLFREVLTQEPNNLRAEYGLALAVWKAPGQGDRAEALKLLGEVSGRDDLTARQLYELGTIYARTAQDLSKAVPLWERARKLDPQFASSVGIDKLLNP
ncbi:MAG: hypothetical protein CMH57_13585 [Myxococcales bacterium]|nr:hypothetical protein [Myxococcales bacterium]